MYAPEQRCAALSQVRQINYCFVREKLTSRFTALHQESARKAPLPWLAGSFFPADMTCGSVWVSLTSDAGGTFLGGLQEQVCCLYPLREKFYCSGQWNWGQPWLFLQVLSVSFTSIELPCSLPFPPLLSHGLASPASQSMPAYSYPKVPALIPTQPKSSCFHFSPVSCG